MSMMFKEFNIVDHDLETEVSNFERVNKRFGNSYFDFFSKSTHPTLQNLAFALRHREIWPEDFTWNYEFCASCAIGLACRIWPQNYHHVRLPPSNLRSLMICARQFDISTKDAETLFFDSRPRRTFLNPFPLRSETQPEDVAKAIDRYIKKYMR